MAQKPKTGVFYGWVVVAAASVILALQWGFDESFGIFFHRTIPGPSLDKGRGVWKLCLVLYR